MLNDRKRFIEDTTEPCKNYPSILETKDKLILLYTNNFKFKKPLIFQKKLLQNLLKLNLTLLLMIAINSVLSHAFFPQNTKWLLSHFLIRVDQINTTS